MYLRRNIFDMNLINFMEQFPDEESCKLKFKLMRDEAGVTCRHCGSKDHYWQQTIWMYECKQCKSPNDATQWHSNASQQVTLSLLVYCYASVNQHKEANFCT